MTKGQECLKSMRPLLPRINEAKHAMVYNGRIDGKASLTFGHVTPMGYHCNIPCMGGTDGVVKFLKRF